MRGQKTDRFLFENSNRPKFNDGEKFCFSSAKVSHRPKFIDLQYKEIKKKKRSKPKVDEIREITIRNKFYKYFLPNSYSN